MLLSIRIINFGSLSFSTMYLIALIESAEPLQGRQSPKYLLIEVSFSTELSGIDEIFQHHVSLVWIET